MKLQQKTYNKFSIVLMMAIAFIALPVVTAAQGKKVTIDFCKTDKTYAGGIHIAAADLNSDGTATNRINVSRISLLTGAFDGGVGVVDSCDADAAGKIKMLFDVRSNLRLINDIVIEIPKDNTPEWFQVTNYLRQAEAGGAKDMNIYIADMGDNLVRGEFVIKMKPVYITSYQTGGTADAPIETFSVNFGAVKFEYRPYDDKDKE